MTDIVEKLYRTGDLTNEEFSALIKTDDTSAAELLKKYADETRRMYYGDKVFLRGLIEISSYCKNDCTYCGIRRSTYILLTKMPAVQWLNKWMLR